MSNGMFIFGILLAFSPIWLGLIICAVEQICETVEYCAACKAERISKMKNEK